MEQLKEVSSVTFRCPSCGNIMEYFPRTPNLKCSYCGTEEKIENITLARENPLDYEKMEDSKFTEEMKLFKCSNCGAMTESIEDIGFVCPYCKKTSVVLKESIKGLRPTGIIPFKIRKEEMEQKQKEWLKKKWFAPRKAKKQDFRFGNEGIYSPCWTFDAISSYSYDGVLGQMRTRTVGSGKNRRTETYIHWFSVSGNGSRHFDDVKVVAGDLVDQSALAKLGSFDTNNAISYDRNFLAGFKCQHYKKDLSEGFAEAQSIMKEKIQEDILAKHNASQVRSLNIKPSYSDQKFKYILLPTYVSSYVFKEKTYSTMANGVTGKLVGSYPKSPLRITLATLFSLALVALAGYLIYML